MEHITRKFSLTVSPTYLFKRVEKEDLVRSNSFLKESFVLETNDRCIFNTLECSVLVETFLIKLRAIVLKRNDILLRSL